jgi:NADPH2:quinone reductase
MRDPCNRVVQIKRFGGPDELEVVDAALPTAGRGEVRVRVLASGLEYTDVLIRLHLYPQTMRRRLPFVMGYDVVGEIDQLGDGVSGLQIGDRVADMTVVGSNAAYCTLRVDRLARVPAGLDAAEAATLILSWTTASSSCTARPGRSAASACSCWGPPAPSVRHCSCSAGWPASSCGALRAARMRR